MPIAGFERMDAMSTRFDDPARASGPFDRDRDGFVVGEGAAFFVLGTEWAARALGVTPYGEIVGYGLTTNAHHLTAPSERGAGAARCMEDALSEDRRRAEAATHVNAHGTSTPANDAAEAAALTRTAGAGDVPPVVALKRDRSPDGAAGAVELAGSMLASRCSTLPPTVNFEEPDDRCLLDISSSPRPLAATGAFLTTSFGFGGQNAALVVRC